jgi:hypothetical protein
MYQNKSKVQDISMKFYTASKNYNYFKEKIKINFKASN